MPQKKYAIGVDYGTSSVRAVLVDIADGSEVSSAIYEYPDGEQGVLSDPKNPLVARQNPQSYIFGFYSTVNRAVELAQARRISPDQIIGVGVDATSSTPIPVNAEGTPLAFLPEFKDNLAAQAWLWKDHSAYEEGLAITKLAKMDRTGYLKKCGGNYSSEWIWAKALHCKKEDRRVFDAAASWVECADFVPAWMTGNLNPSSLVRGICSAGHKGLYHEKWGGLPSEKFLAKIDPDLVRFRERFTTALTSDKIAGYLTEDNARKTGLPAGLPISVGAIDAHLGALGAGVKPGTLVEVIGTSACYMTVHPLSEAVPDIPGLCGIVPGSIIPDMFGFEAGQPAVGDIFNWFVNLLGSEDPTGVAKNRSDRHNTLTEEAALLKPGQSGLLALDWNNGNRSLLSDSRLTGLLLGQTLSTTPAEIYRALIEATAFGGLTIIRRFEEYKIPIKQVIFTGGIAEKNPLLVQIYADVYNRPVMISRNAQTCALGAAICGAVAGGGYKSVSQAIRKMTGVKPHVYKPNKKSAAVYERLFGLYQILHDGFGGVRKSVDLRDVMHQLAALRDQARE